MYVTHFMFYSETELKGPFDFVVMEFYTPEAERSYVKKMRLEGRRIKRLNDNMYRLFKAAIAQGA